MADRYEFRQIGENSGVVIYTLGPYFRVECNSSSGKTIVTNEITGAFLEDQFDRIFDLGEYKKFSKHMTSHTTEKNPGNPHSVKHTLVADYIPKIAKKDIKSSLPKVDLIEKFFKDD